MYSLRVLGGVALEGPGDSPVGGFSQRRAEAVLAVLAVAGDLGCTRDRLIALLWPESDEARGRHSLRDAIHAVRTVLGPESILTGLGGTLRLNPAVVTSDAQRFAKALAVIPPSEAAEIYRGPVLDGFHVDGAPEFERWLDAERSRFLGRFEEAIASLAGQAEQTEHWRETAQWWGRGVSLDPFNTRLVVRRMWALARAGDRANAVREGEAHQQRLVVELELEPEAAFLKELERVRTADLGPPHYRTPADSTVNPPSPPPPQVASAPSPPSPPVPSHARRWWIAVVLSLLLAVVLLVVLR